MSNSRVSDHHKRNQKGLAPAYGLRCAQVPSLRSCSVATPYGPSMAQHGSPGIHAGRTTTQNLRSASRRGLKIKIKSRSKADQKRPCRRCFDFCFLLLKTMSLPPLDSRNDADAHHNSAGVRAPGEPRRVRPYGRAQTFWFLLGRLPKGTRRKGETRKKP